MRAKTFTEEQEKFIADHYSDVSDRELADLMNEAYDIGVAARQVATVRKRLGFKKSVLGRPKKAVAEKKPAGSQSNALPIGSKRVMGGYVWVKIDDKRHLKSPIKNWQREHLLVWEKAHGSIPEGHCVMHINRDKTDNRLKNLVCVKRQVVSYMCKRGLWSDDPEILKANLLMAEVSAKIYERQGKSYKRKPKPEHKKTGPKKGKGNSERSKGNGTAA